MEHLILPAPSALGDEWRGGWDDLVATGVDMQLVIPSSSASYRGGWDDISPSGISDVTMSPSLCGELQAFSLFSPPTYHELSVLKFPSGKSPRNIPYCATPTPQAPGVTPLSLPLTRYHLAITDEKTTQRMFSDWALTPSSTTPLPFYEQSESVRSDETKWNFTAVYNSPGQRKVGNIIMKPFVSLRKKLSVKIYPRSNTI